jgi:uncharacterized membrane protein YdjX (TVP38/TMEM64 family)
MLLRRLAALVPVLFAAIAAGFLLPHSPSELRDVVLAAGVAAPAIVLAAWVVLTPALFPGTVLAAAGGMAFGTVGGTAVALGGAVLGGLAAFTLARTAARRPAAHFAQRSPRLARLRLSASRSPRRRWRSGAAARC